MPAELFQTDERILSSRKDTILARWRIIFRVTEGERTVNYALIIAQSLQGVNKIVNNL